MAYDIRVERKSREEIEEIAEKLREKYVPETHFCIDILTLVEFKLHKAFKGFEFEVLPDSELIDESGNYTEAVTDLSKPSIKISETTYKKLSEGDGRSRFTLAHEVGHLILHMNHRHYKLMHRYHGDYRTPTNDENKNQSAEWQANVFAASLLMPAKLVRKIQTANDVSNIFGVSKQTAEIRFNSNEVGKQRKLPDYIIAKINKFKRSIGAPEIRFD